MNNKVLTVSVAAYNVEKYLRNTLDSLLIGDLLDYIEVFVIDDGGTDNSLQIAKEYEEKFPGVFFAVHKDDQGYGSTVNYSIENANGKYFKILDGDDWFNKNEFYSFVDKLKCIDDDMVVTRFQRVFDRTGKIEVVDETVSIPSSTCLFDNIDSTAWFTMHAITFKTRLLQEHSIRLTTNCFYADSEYNLLPIRNINTIRRLSENVYCYRIGTAEQSVSPAGIEKHHQDQLKILKRLYEEYADLQTDNVKDTYVYNYLVRWTNSYLANLLIISKSNKHKEEIKDFMYLLRNTQNHVYKGLLKKSKLAKVLIFSNFGMYGLLHNYMLNKIKKDK